MKISSFRISSIFIILFFIITNPFKIVGINDSFENLENQTACEMALFYLLNSHHNELDQQSKTVLYNIIKITNDYLKEQMSLISDDQKLQLKCEAAHFLQTYLSEEHFARIFPNNDSDQYLNYTGLNKDRINNFNDKVIELYKKFAIQFDIETKI